MMSDHSPIPSHDEPDRCIACDVPFAAGDLVLSEASGGLIHAACCGPERESYVNADGDPLSDDEPIPAGWPYTPARGTSPSPIVDEVAVTLASCPFCGATPHRGKMGVQYDQLHGEPFQRYRVWCPHGCASIDRINEEQARAAWNTRHAGAAPIAWLLNHPDHGERLSQSAITDGDRSLGWVDMPLYAIRAASPASPPKAEAGEPVMYVEPTWPPMPGAYATPEPRGDVREEDGGLDAGINYAIRQLCEILDVDPHSISWDAATETMDGDVSSVICNVLRAAYGEEWSSKPEDTARMRAALEAALNSSLEAPR